MYVRICDIPVDDCSLSVLLTQNHQCLLRGCASKMHSSLPVLIMHIDSTHLPKIPLSCPIMGKLSQHFAVVVREIITNIGCFELFSRNHGVESHLRHEHSNLFSTGQEVFTVSTDQLKLSSAPRHRTLDPPMLSCWLRHNIFVYHPYIQDRDSTACFGLNSAMLLTSSNLIAVSFSSLRTATPLSSSLHTHYLQTKG